METITKSNLLAEIEILYKSKVKQQEQPQIKSGSDSANYLRSVWNDNKIEHVEEFLMLLLNANSRVLGWVKISQGGVMGTIIDPKVIFQCALNANATSIILAHNHPSGNLIPSYQDIQATKKIVDGGKILDIRVLDHIILTSDSFYSFAENGDI